MDCVAVRLMHHWMLVRGWAIASRGRGGLNANSCFSDRYLESGLRLKLATCSRWDLECRSRP